MRRLGMTEIQSWTETQLTSNRAWVGDVRGALSHARRAVDAAEKVGIAVRGGDADRGIVLCGSGVGAVMAANRMDGVRAGLGHDTYSARQGVEHDDMNVLVMGRRIIGPELARELVRAYLGAEFTEGERHLRRLKKIHALEERYHQ